MRRTVLSVPATVPAHVAEAALIAATVIRAVYGGVLVTEVIGRGHSTLAAYLAARRAA